MGLTIKYIINIWTCMFHLSVLSTDINSLINFKIRVYFWVFLAIHNFQFQWLKGIISLGDKIPMTCKYPLEMLRCWSNIMYRVSQKKCSLVSSEAFSLKAHFLGHPVLFNQWKNFSDDHFFFRGTLWELVKDWYVILN